MIDSRDESDSLVRPMPYIPLELVSYILHFAASSGTTWVVLSRNRDLAAFSLVSTVWHADANSILYGDLRIIWRSISARLLLESLATNPELLSLVRRFSAEFLSRKGLEVEEFSRLQDLRGPKMVEKALRRIQWKQCKGWLELADDDDDASSFSSHDDSDSPNLASSDSEDSDEAHPYDIAATRLRRTAARATRAALEETREEWRNDREGLRCYYLASATRSANEKLVELAQDGPSGDYRFWWLVGREGWRAFFRLVSEFPRLKHLALSNIPFELYLRIPATSEYYALLELDVATSSSPDDHLSRLTLPSLLSLHSNVDSPV